MIRSATFSEDRKRRFDLVRDWRDEIGAPDKTVLFAGLNPSDAGEEKDDPTVRKTVGFGRRWGSDRLTITEEGFAVLGDYDPLPTGRDLLAYWKQREGKAERSILECLAECGPTVDRSALAEATGYAEAGGGFGNALSRLRALGLISGSKEITIAEELLG